MGRDGGRKEKSKERRREEKGRDGGKGRKEEKRKRKNQQK